MSYGGPGALARAQLARDVVLERLKLTGVMYEDIRAELIGVDCACTVPNWVHGRRSSPGKCACAWRHVVQTRPKRCASAMKWKPYTNGPYGGGGASKCVRQVVAVASLLLPRDAVTLQVHLEDMRISGIKLRELAHSRTGDKGDTSNISVIAYRAEDYPRLCE